ncbi:MAG: TetR/AcrR family transcriptional regulator [Rhodospirillaceae bacterium]|nr:TetR/AcrR family transcriptional regulator [Rhodospirillaceae bacterium]
MSFAATSAANDMDELSDRNQISRSPRVAQRRERMRQNVLRVGAKMFLDRGIENVSVEEILAAAGLARSTFYSFFTSKRDLVFHILDPVFQTGVNHMKDQQGKSPADIVYGVIDMYPMLWEKYGEALFLRIGHDEFNLIAKTHNQYVEMLDKSFSAVEAAGILRNGSSTHTQRLIARCAIEVVRVYRNDPSFKALYRSTMEGMLLTDDAHRPPL